MPLLQLEERRRERIEHVLTILVIVAALMTIPLTVAYWLRWQHWLVDVADWTLWGVFLVEYGFYMAVSNDRWQTTKNLWLSGLIVILSFPLLHEVLRATRLIRVFRFIPLLRQLPIIRNLQFLKLGPVRTKGTNAGWVRAKERLDEDHPVRRWMDWAERLKAWAIRRVWPGSRSSGGE